MTPEVRYPTSGAVPASSTLPDNDGANTGSLTEIPAPIPENPPGAVFTAVVGSTVVDGAEDVSSVWAVLAEQEASEIARTTIIPTRRMPCNSTRSVRLPSSSRDRVAGPAVGLGSKE